MMPVMDGFQVMEGLRAVEAESGLPAADCERLPVLVLTAQLEHKERALKAGAKGFITKPFDRLAVLTHIRDVLEIRFLQKELQQFVVNLEIVLHKRTASMREAEELFDQLAGNLPQVFWIWDVEDRTLRYINPAWEKLTGRRVAPGDKVEKFLEAVHPDDLQRVIGETGELLQEGVDHDYRLLLSDNSIRWVHSRSFPIKDSTGAQKVVGIMDDITDRKQADLRLLHLAHYDALTSLPNRTLFYESLRKLIKQAEMNHRMISVLFLDIDDFKNINEHLGTRLAMSCCVSSVFACRNACVLRTWSPGWAVTSSDAFWSLPIAPVMQEWWRARSEKPCVSPSIWAGIRQRLQRVSASAFTQQTRLMQTRW